MVQRLVRQRRERWRRRRRTSVAERTGTLHTLFSLTDPFSASHIYDCPDHSGTKIYTDTQTVSIIFRRKGKYAIETTEAGMGRDALCISI